MSLPTPTARPGTQLFPEDRAREAKVVAPDHSGTTCQIGWAAWEQSLLGSATTYLEAALYDEDGRVYARRGPASGGRKAAWHEFATLGDLRLYCLRYRLRDVDGGDPFTVQQERCQDVWQMLSARRVGPCAAEVGREEVETHSRRQDGQITRHHCIQQ